VENGKMNKKHLVENGKLQKNIWWDVQKDLSLPKK
jgi:hypothetical protein